MKKLIYILITIVLSCFCYSCNNTKKSIEHGYEEDLSKEIYLNWSDSSNPIIPVFCYEGNLLDATGDIQKNCSFSIDIGVRNLKGLGLHTYKNRKNVKYPKEGWNIEKRSIDGGDVDCKISSKGKKLVIIGKKPGSVIVTLSHSDCLYSKTIFVSVKDWNEYKKN
ncbi:hypothetical protein [Treponema pectinovorum]|uniref:hypothetical protein n=1 Tax=Treponema pectinovorum TaxID=164 RepID=UPI0011F19887|nr:hypothetical protein [Treponema pectinovorum]